LLDGQRHWNRRGLQAYLSAIEAGRAPHEGSECLDPVTARQERLWLQLRTCAGATLQPRELQALLSAPKFQAMLDADLMTLTPPCVRLTPSGFLLADAIGVEVLTSLERRQRPLPLGEGGG